MIIKNFKILFQRLIIKTYHILFPFVKKCKDLQKENNQLKYQLEYLKRHSDIKLLLPATGELREFQLKNLEYVNGIVKRLEKDLGIKAFLEGGALLGYVRHNGYIPWDDDLDFGLSRKEFDLLVEYAKNNFVWFDTHFIKEDAAKEYDKIIRQNPDKEIAILTPYCLHIYKGTSMNDVLNAEFFPWDFIPEDIEENNFLKAAKEYKEKLLQLHTWDKIFEYIEDNNNYLKLFTKNQTTKISPGNGHWDMAKQTIRGWHNIEDIYPLKEIVFEGKKLYIPNNPEKYLSLAYGNYMDYPNDFGISHNIEEIKNTLNKK